MVNLLVTGGSGYLGQHIIHQLSGRLNVNLLRCYNILYTFSTNELASVPEKCKGYKVNLATGDGLGAVFNDQPIEVVINCAAISQPGLCEKNPEQCRSVNVPTKLIDHLINQRDTTGKEALLIHISTDQVYDGSKSLWSEDDACAPLNEYGRSKLAAEAEIQARWPAHVILRSSIIYGAPPPHPVPRSLFLQFVDDALSSGKPTTFFNDEFRSPVYVKDIIKVIEYIVSRLPPRKLYNLGGPERLSRVDMATKVAECRGYNLDAVVPASSSTIDRGVASPADISMHVESLQRDLGIALTPFSEALKEIFPEASKK